MKATKERFAPNPARGWTVVLCALAAVMATSLALSSASLAADLNVAAILAQVRNSGKSPWTSVPMSDVRFLVTESATLSKAIGFTSEELSGLEPNSLDAGIFSVRMPLPPVDFFTGCDDLSCGENQAWSPEERALLAPVIRLKEKIGKPILITGRSLPPEWERARQEHFPEVTPSLLFTAVAFHEFFHTVQSRIDKPLPSPVGDTAQCLKRPEFKAAFAADLGKWRAVVEAPMESKLAAILTATKFRTENPDPCFGSASYRKEGIPSFFAYKALITSSAFSKAEVDHFFVISWLTPYNGFNLHYYDYGLGTAIALALEALGGDGNWQAAVENGAPMFETLLKRLPE